MNAAYVDERLAAMQQSLQSQLAAVAATSNTKSETIYQTLGAVARIENLDDINLDDSDITNSRIVGGSISGATISGTISSTINSLLGTIDDLTSTTITATNVTFENATTTNLAVTGTASTSALVVSGLNSANCDVKASSAGVLSCGTDVGGSFGQSWSIIGSAYLAPTTTLGVIVSASSTIGSGTQAGGLTISGGATTTGNAYFGDVGIGHGTGTFTNDVLFTVRNASSDLVTIRDSANVMAVDGNINADASACYPYYSLSNSGTFALSNAANIAWDSTGDYLGTKDTGRRALPLACSRSATALRATR